MDNHNDNDIDEYWTHKKGFIPPYVFEPFLEIMKEYFPFSSKNRISCYFDGIHKNDNNDNDNDDKRDELREFYFNTSRYDWKDASDVLVEIAKLVEQYTNQKYDYVLVHLYKDGNGAIAWHNDTEAMNSQVASVSLGATRKFRLRKIGRTRGWNAEFNLGNGDLFIMHGPNSKTGRKSCQELFEHTVPAQKRIKTPRINLTFRQYK